jgi:hypothetical protein
MRASHAIDGTMTGMGSCLCQTLSHHDPQAERDRDDCLTSGAQGRRCPRGNRIDGATLGYLPKYPPNIPGQCGVRDDLRKRRRQRIIFAIK